MSQGTMQWQLVGKGDVVVLTMPHEDGTTMHVAMSDANFIKGLKGLIRQAKVHPDSLLRLLRVEDER